MYVCMYVCSCVCQLMASLISEQRSHFGLVSLFSGISTFVGYLMLKPSFEKISSGTIFNR